MRFCNSSFLKKDRSPYKKGSVIGRNSQSEYVGTCEGPFKDRFDNHTKFFRNRKYESDTELSKLIWALKGKGENPTVK